MLNRSPGGAEVPKRAVNLSLNAELLRQAKELGLNLSSLAEDAVALAVKNHLAQRWQEENAAAIRAYNKRVAKRGVFSDGLRRF